MNNQQISNVAAMQQTVHTEDDELYFSKSMLLNVTKLNQTQKFHFRIQIMTYLQTLLDSGNIVLPRPQTHANSYNFLMPQTSLRSHPPLIFHRYLMFPLFSFQLDSTLIIYNKDPSSLSHPDQKNTIQSNESEDIEHRTFLK